MVRVIWVFCMLTVVVSCTSTRWDAGSMRSQRLKCPGRLRWVCDPRVPLAKWGPALLGKQRTRVPISDFSVVDGTVIAIGGSGLWMQIDRSSGSVTAADSTAFGRDLVYDSQARLYGGYYLEGNALKPSRHRLFVVTPDSDPLRVQRIRPAAWLVCQWLPRYLDGWHGDLLARALHSPPP